MRRSNRLEELVIRHQNALLRAALSVTGSMADAEDAVQDAYLKYLEKLPVFDSERSERAWLMRVAVNGALDRLRDRARHPTQELSDIYPAPDSHTGELVDAVMELPANQRAAVHLFYYEQMDTASIAKILRCRPGTVRSYLSRARDELRRKLKGDIEL